jgi:hypothetical protein
VRERESLHAFPSQTASEASGSSGWIGSAAPPTGESVAPEPDDGGGDGGTGQPEASLRTAEEGDRGHLSAVFSLTPCRAAMDETDQPWRRPASDVGADGCRINRLESV